MVTGNGTCSSWDHQSLPCCCTQWWAHRHYHRCQQLLLLLPAVPVLAQAGRDTTSLQLPFCISMAPGVSKKLEKAVIFQTLLSLEAEARPAMQWGWWGALTARVAGGWEQRGSRTEPSSFQRTMQKRSPGGSKYAGDSFILYHIVYYVLYLSKIDN